MHTPIEKQEKQEFTRHRASQVSKGDAQARVKKPKGLVLSLTSTGSGFSPPPTETQYLIFT